jgi:hypothetical protein
MGTDNKATSAMTGRAEKIADGRAPLKKTRFLKVTGDPDVLGASEH